MAVYQTRRKMRLAGQDFPAGTIIPDDVLEQMPVGRLDSMRRIGLVTEEVAKPKPRRRRSLREKGAETAPKSETEEVASAPEST